MRTMTRTGLRAAVGAFALSVATFVACGGDDEQPRALDPDDLVPNPMIDASMSGMAGSTPDASEDSSSGGAGGTGGSGGSADDAGDALTNCGDITCSGPGHCVIENGMPSCECDPGYVTTGVGATFNCIVDRTCAKVRLLDGGCRVRLLGPNAVSLLFAVDYCSGDPVLPADLGNLDDAFDIFENNQPIRANPESSFTVIEKDVESFVTIALDVSESISADPNLLRQLAGAVKVFVSRLESLRAIDDPPITLALIVFGRTVELLVPPTQDVAVVNAALTQLETAPTSILQRVRTDGTALYRATERAILETERIKGFRHVVSDWGVLTSGTVVVVTDGRESSNATLNTQLLTDTRVNVISVGVSNDIDDAYLSSIGRDGSFLAPLPEDWTATFETIATRVDQHPDRTYLIGYCSSASEGQPTVSVGLSGFASVTTAQCQFNAEFFGTDPEDVCSADFFQQECQAMACGGLTACGACLPDECCDNGGRCVSPSSAPPWVDTTTPTCNGMDQLCHPTDQVCVDDLDSVTAPGRFSCQPPLAVGTDCGQGTIGRCEDGVAYCGDVPSDGGPVKQCLLTLPNGSLCAAGTQPGDPRQCAELRCGRQNPDNDAEPFECLPQARMFDACDNADVKAVCEPGTGCQSGVCKLLAPSGLVSCNTDQECSTGYCAETSSHLCEYTGMCHYSWSEMLDR